MTDRPLLTRSEICAAVRALGVRPGGVLMFHTRMSALGHVVGGADSIILALQDAVGPQGTLMVLTGWDDDPFELEHWETARQQAYLRELPAFDPKVSASARGMGTLPERLRTWPGALRSDHPECSVAALGPAARHLIHPHPAHDAFGADTPLSRLVALDGQVLMLGAPLDTITLLHHAETVAAAGPKIRVTYRMPVLEGGERVWRDFRDINSSSGAYDYTKLAPEGVDPFEFLARCALSAGVGTAGLVGMGESHLFEARALVRFAVDWLERAFPAHAGPTNPAES